MNIQPITDFILSNSTYTDRDVVETFVKKSIEYRTGFVITSCGLVIGYMRLNILPNGAAHVLDMIVDKDRRDGRVLAEMIEIAHLTWPEVTEVIFERGYDDGTTVKTFRRYNVEKLLRRAKHVFQEA
jgi:hypothetical protein